MDGVTYIHFSPGNQEEENKKHLNLEGNNNQ